METAIKDHFIANLPKKPYNTNNPSNGLFIGKRDNAISKKYIQFNNPIAHTWIVFDIDRPDAFQIDGAQRTLPPPTLEVRNPVNRHAHWFYGLHTPVLTSDLASLKPVQFLASLEYALTRTLQADSNYVGLIAKNPLHDCWETFQHRGLWEMNELADWLELPSYIPKEAYESGVGRNCSLFDTVRHWAYREVQSYKTAHNSKDFHRAVHKVTTDLNANFQTPLSAGEVKTIAKSIATWTWKRYTGRLSDKDWAQYVKDTHTPEIQRRRAKAAYLVGAQSKGGEARSAKYQEKKEQALGMLYLGTSTKEVADFFKVGLSTVYKWIREDKEAKK